MIDTVADRLGEKAEKMPARKKKGGGGGGGDTR